MYFPRGGGASSLSSSIIGWSDGFSLLNNKAAVILADVAASAYITYSGNLGLIPIERATCEVMACPHQRGCQFPWRGGSVSMVVLLVCRVMVLVWRGAAEAAKYRGLSERQFANQFF